MKLRTKNDLKDFLDKDLAWRKLELSLMLTNTKSAESKSLNYTLRTSVLLLYAHWEGFIKRAGEAYLNYVSNQNLQMDGLNDNFLAIALKQKIALLENSKDSTIHCEFVRYFKNKLSEPAKLDSANVISANSNLNSKILKQILTAIGISYAPYELKANIIDEKLLHYRNTIAHGEFLQLDKEEYKLIHNEIFAIIMDIKTSIENDVALNKYKA